MQTGHQIVGSMEISKTEVARFLPIAFSAVSGFRRPYHMDKCYQRTLRTETCSGSSLYIPRRHAPCIDRRLHLLVQTWIGFSSKCTRFSLSPCIEAASDSALTSVLLMDRIVELSEHSDFSLENIPYGVFSDANNPVLRPG